MRALIIAYPHSDAACLLNGTVGVIFRLRLPNIMPAKKIEVQLAPPCSFPVLTTIFSATFPTTVYSKRRFPGIIRPVRGSLPLTGKHHRHKITSQGSI